MWYEQEKHVIILGWNLVSKKLCALLIAIYTNSHFTRCEIITWTHLVSLFSWKEQILSTFFSLSPSLPHIHCRPLASSLICPWRCAIQQQGACLPCEHACVITHVHCVIAEGGEGPGGGGGTFDVHGCYVDGWLCLETEEVWVNMAQLRIGEAAGRGQRSADEKAQS